MESGQREPSFASYEMIPDHTAPHDPLLEDEGASKGVCSDWLGRPIGDDRANLMGGWKCSACILGAFAFSSFAYFGIILNLVVYLVEVAGLTNAEAANTVTNMSGTSLLFSLGAYMGDAYMGRLRASLIFQTFNLLSYVFVSTAVLLISKGLATASTRTFLLVSLYLVAVTGGPILPINIVVGADQLATVRDKEKFFRLIIVAVSAGQLLSITFVSYIENMGMWVWGFGLSTIAVMVLLMLLAAMVRFFRQYKDSGSPFLQLVRVPVAAWRKRSLSLSCNSRFLLQYEQQGEVSSISCYQQHQHTRTLSFLDKAAVLVPTDADNQPNPWRLCTVTQVEEFKSLLRVIPIGISMAVAHAAYGQVSTFFEEQASLMNRQVTTWLVIPAASLNIFAIGSAILTGIVATTCGSATLKRRWYRGRSAKEGDGKRALTSLQFQRVGLLCNIVVMVIAALVESHRRHEAQKGTRLSVLWLVPQTVLAGIAYYLTKVGGTEFSYSEVSMGLRVVSTSIFNVFEGVGSYLSSLLVTVVTAITTQGGKPGWIASDLNEGHLDYFYWCLASCVAVMLCIFLAYSHNYTKITTYEKESEGSS